MRCGKLKFAYAGFFPNKKYLKILINEIFQVRTNWAKTFWKKYFCQKIQKKIFPKNLISPHLILAEFLFFWGFFASCENSESIFGKQTFLSKTKLDVIFTTLTVDRMWTNSENECTNSHKLFALSIRKKLLLRAEKI